jgi:putative ABC transport system substrate-binding protein
MVAGTAVALLLVFALCHASEGTAAPERIAVFISSSASPFDKAFTGFQNYLAQQGIDAEYDVYRLSGETAQAEKALENAKKSAPRLLLTFGSIAAEAATQSTSDTPVVACMVLRTDFIRRTANATGVGLEFPLETQLNWIQKILPQARTIGVIYSPDENEKQVAKAERIARNLGLTLEAIPVEAPEDVPPALSALSKNVDALWGIADTITLSPQLAKYVLLFSFRNKIPFIGPSDTWVKSGALYALDWDFEDLGAQCGNQAVRILQGVPAGSLTPATPRKAFYSLNLNTAEQMKITIPEEIIKKARNAY